MADFDSITIPRKRRIEETLQKKRDNPLTEGQRIAVTIDGVEVKGYTVPSGKVVYGTLDVTLEERDA